MKRHIAMVIAGAGLLLGTAVLVGMGMPTKRQATLPLEPVWAEAKWPFPIDQWGTGRAFACAAQNCGIEVSLYIRPKIGFCNCATGVADNAELERVADTELVSQQLRPRGPSRPIKVGWMHGLSRSYWASEGETKESLLSVAFNDECDVVVAVVKLAGGDPGILEPEVIAFLNTNPMVLWTKKELGLEFVRRDW
jgi:hypothetical protein